MGRLGPADEASAECMRLARIYFWVSAASGTLATIFFLVIPITSMLTGRFTSLLMIVSGTTAIVLYLVYDRYSVRYSVFIEADCFFQTSHYLDVIHHLKRWGRPHHRKVFYKDMEQVSVRAASRYVVILTKAGESYYVPKSFIPNPDRLVRDAESFGVRVVRE